MTYSPRPATALAGLALAAAPFLLVADPAVADGNTKAAIEHAESQAVATTPSKAQIEHQERAQQSTGGMSQPQSPQLPSPASGGGGAAAWQLALSAAFGATLAGGVLVASRQMTNHRHAVAH